MYTTGCEVCEENVATTTMGDMCLCAPCAGATPAHATSGLADLISMTSPVHAFGLDPISLGRKFTQQGSIPGTAAYDATHAFTQTVDDVASTVKWVVIAGSVAVIALVGYELFKKKPAREAA